MIDFSWMDDGACLDPAVDPDLFFPGENDHKSVNKARVVCMRCPVRQRCLDHALAYHEDGVWGATTEYERRNMRKRSRTG